jgi:hypothetical protein
MRQHRWRWRWRCEVGGGGTALREVNADAAGDDVRNLCSAAMHDAIEGFDGNGIIFPLSATDYYFCGWNDVKAGGRGRCILPYLLFLVDHGIASESFRIHRMLCKTVQY